MKKKTHKVKEDKKVSLIFGQYVYKDVWFCLLKIIFFKDLTGENLSCFV